MQESSLHKILIVDDQPENLKAIADCFTLNNLPYQILKAPDGVIALKLLEGRKVDLVITDWEMPNMDGLDLIKNIKANEKTKDIPVIMCTGVMTTSENLNVAIRAGAVDFVRKPIDSVELVARVHSMLCLSDSIKKIKQQKEDIAIEKNKVESLLLNILPKRIVADLSETGRTEPDLYHDVSVFFSDFVGFTEISSKLEPQTLIGELNELFTEFDAIMEENSCERIKTIGDAYLAVCGMPEANTKHAENLTRAALCIIKYLKKRNEQNKIKWTIRIGIHSGSVTGGVVGTKKYIYDVFGDTINIASRMESNSEPMRINLSEVTYNIIKDCFEFEARQPIDVKGKGITNMYFVKSK